MATLGILVDCYLTHQAASGRTPKTVVWHRNSLRQFAAWVEREGHPEDPGAWTAAMLRSYVLWQSTRAKADGKPLSGTALSSLIRSLRAFCRWLHADGWVDRDPFARVKVPPEPRLAKRALSADEAGRLLAAARLHQRNPLRNEALILFLLDTGCRAGEVCTLRASAIDWSSRIARVMGKGRKERFVPFSPATAKAMRRYELRERPEGGDYFFRSLRGDRLTTSGLVQAIRFAGKRAGVPVHPHMLRHTFAITSLRNGASVFAVQKMLGHESLNVTLRYTTLVTDDIIAEHERSSPVAGLLGRKRPAA